MTTSNVRNLIKLILFLIKPQVQIYGLKYEWILDSYKSLSMISEEAGWLNQKLTFRWGLMFNFKIMLFDVHDKLRAVFREWKLQVWDTWINLYVTKFGV